MSIVDVRCRAMARWFLLQTDPFEGNRDDTDCGLVLASEDVNMESGMTVNLFMYTR